MAGASDKGARFGVMDGEMKRKRFIIPTNFELGFRKYQVWYDNKQIYRKAAAVGTLSLGTGDMYLQTPVKDGVDDLAVKQAFLHELVHGILYSMGESELCHDERFVDGFAHLLLQFHLTWEGDLLKVWKNDLKEEKKKNDNGKS